MDRNITLELQKIQQVTKLIKKLNKNKIITSENITYELLDNIWSDYVNNKYKIKNNFNTDIINLGSVETVNSVVLEDIFNKYIDSSRDNIIMIYQKNKYFINYYVKSSLISIYTNSIPYYKIRIPIYDDYKYFNEFLKHNQILISYIN